MNRRRIKIAAAAVLVAGLVGGGAAWATAGDDETPLTGAVRDRAIDAALEYTGGGTVTETEAGDDGTGYGVEVRVPDGRQVEVQLDEQFAVIADEADDDGSDDRDEQGDD